MGACAVKQGQSPPVGWSGSGVTPAKRSRVALALDLRNIDLEEIATALADWNDYEHHRLINPYTGQIALWTADTGIDRQTPA